MESQNRQASRTEAKPSVASNFYPRDGRERCPKAAYKLDTGTLSPHFPFVMGCLLCLVTVDSKHVGLPT